jgi:hypothetical protein
MGKSMKQIKYITYEHPVTMYVPVYQKSFDVDGSLLSAPTFEYSLSEASTDQQLIASMNPDYILELRGYFNATTREPRKGDL